MEINPTIRDKKKVFDHIPNRPVSFLVISIYLEIQPGLKLYIEDFSIPLSFKKDKTLNPESTANANRNS